MNEIIRNLTIQNLNNFLNSFEETKKIFWDEERNRLRHSGEFGAYREELVKKWLRIVVPEQFGISSGFVIAPKGSISTQCDIIIYDKMKTPRIENIDNQRFFPIETVCCVGEVKSDINSIADLNQHLIKLSTFKKLRDESKESSPYTRHSFNFDYSPLLNPWDNIFTFLICRKFAFPVDVSKIDYGNVEQRLKHNLVLSIQDGLLSYETPQKTPNQCMPFVGETILNDYFKPNDKTELPSHIVSFLHYISQAVDMTTLLSLEIGGYLNDSLLLDVK